jgi:hypothetical protein
VLDLPLSKSRGEQAVVDVTVVQSPPRPRKKRREDRPAITLPNGKVLLPRIMFAASVGLAERSVARLNLPTVYIGSCAYIDRDEGLRQLAAPLKRRNEPPRRRRRR